jgi:hypothetical protein
MNILTVLEGHLIRLAADAGGARPAPAPGSEGPGGRRTTRGEKGDNMGGLFGIVSSDDCVSDLFCGTDYHSHLGTRLGGMAVRNPWGIQRSIHNLENSYFRTKFEPELANFRGNDGIGVISDTDPQPLLVASHLGTLGIVTVGKVNNLLDARLSGSWSMLKTGT